MQELTPCLDNVICFIVQYRNEHGYSPSLPEIGIKICRHKGTVGNHIAALRRKGWLKPHDPSKWEMRNCRLTVEAIEWFGWKCG